MWSLDQISKAFAPVISTVSIPGSLSLPLFDPETGIGVGVDNDGDGCLLLPGYGELNSFKTSALQFDPWREVTWVEKNRVLPRSAVLKCRFPSDDPEVVRVVAAIFLSLIDMQTQFGDAGRAIWKIRDMFSDGFTVTVSSSVLTGLIGELIWIWAQDEPANAIRAWHPDADDRYDFSSGSQRIEVKTTRGTVREHQFNSRQLPAAQGIQVFVISILLKVVAEGHCVADLYNNLSKSINKVDRQKLIDVILETTGMPPLLITEPKFDLEGSVASLATFDSKDVPTPTIKTGVIQVEWRAYLDQANSRNLHGIF
jgi:hypothetical protein